MRFIAFDLETTGINISKDRAYEYIYEFLLNEKHLLKRKFSLKKEMIFDILNFHQDKTAKERLKSDKEVATYQKHVSQAEINLEILSVCLKTYF